MLITHISTFDMSLDTWVHPCSHKIEWERGVRNAHLGAVVDCNLTLSGCNFKDEPNLFKTDVYCH